MEKKTIGVATINTITLRNYLAKAEDTEKIIPYTELSALIRTDVQSYGRGSLFTSKKSTNKITQRVMEHEKALAHDETLRLFGGCEA